MAGLVRASEYDINRLKDFIFGASQLLILTGAGCSTESGIPDYRSVNGSYSKGHKPVQHSAFMNSEAVRQRFWGRSLQGWHKFDQAQPNDAHHAIARLEKATALNHVITQNVDRLHHKAGSLKVLELHGYASDAGCTNPNCGEVMSRADFHHKIRERNDDWVARYISPNTQNINAIMRADGDASVEADFSQLLIPNCFYCGGVIKPTLVFFGGSVPESVTAKAKELVSQCDAVLVVGSSLQVYSGFRHVREASQRGVPVAVLNHGETRADDIISFKVEASCAETLSAIVADLPELEE